MPRQPLSLSAARAASLALSLLAASAPAQPVAPSLSAELAFPHPEHQPDPRHQYFASLAQGDGGYLLVFNEGTSASGVPGVIGVRLDAAGGLVDGGRLSLGGGSSGYRPAVTWDGQRYLVVTTTGSEVTATWISPGGQLIGAPLAVASAASSQDSLRWPSVACGVTECLIAFWKYNVNVGHRVLLARVAGGALLQGDLPVTSASSDQHEPSVSWTGAEYVVVWRDIRAPGKGDVYGARVTPAGAVLDPNGFPISSGAAGEITPSACWAGDHLFAVWADDRSGTSEAYAARLSAAGVLSDASGLRLATERSSWPQAVCNGAGQLALWTSGAASVSSSGVSQRLTVPLLGQPAAAPRGPAEHVLAWDRANSGSDVYVAVLSDAGLSQPTYVARAPSAEEAVAAAFDGANYLVAWADHRDGIGEMGIYAARVSAAGNLLDPAGIFLGRGNFPRVAFGGGVFLVAFSRPLVTPDVVSVRVGQDGVPLDGEPVPLAAAGQYGGRPDVAFLGSGFLVVFVDGPDDTRQVQGQRVGLDGRPLGAPFQLSKTGARFALKPRIVPRSDGALVVFEDHSSSWDIPFAAGVRVRADGRPLDCESLPLIRPSGLARTTEVAVARGPAGYLLVAESGGKIVGRRVSASGNPQGPAPFTIASGAVGHPAVAWDGAAYVVSWAKDLGNDAGRALQLARVSVDGRVLDPLPVAVAETVWGRSTADSHRPALAAEGNGRSLLLYPRLNLPPEHATSPSLYASHLFARQVSGAANGSGCADAGLCQSGACVAGLCCDRQCQGGCPSGVCSDPAPTEDALPLDGGGYGCGDPCDLLAPGFSIDAYWDAGCLPEGEPGDGGATGGEEPPREGCGCQATGGAGALFALLLLLRARARPSTS